ncbi:hypothetical protein [Bradyrhizobium sp. dw_78]|uniref:hypothetical protein n=1 Tax=Bradyrhizobium sp. dw_78 TaxID=2719793 RepID=UPI001BD5A91C|nr:hypothetical protein [Bradyrhizobium sp. dw_78]
MSMQRSAALILFCLGLTGCGSVANMYMAAPTSGPAMAWDGAGQAPDQGTPRTRRPRRPEAEIVTGSLNAMQPDQAAQARAADSFAAQQPDQTAIAEAQLKDRLVICRGCLSEPSAAPTESAQAGRQMTAAANP